MTTALWEPAAAADSRHRMAAIFVHNHSPARGRHFAVFFLLLTRAFEELVGANAKKSAAQTNSPDLISFKLVVLRYR